MKHPQYTKLELIEPNYSRQQGAKAAKLLCQGLSFSAVAGVNGAVEAGGALGDLLRGVAVDLALRQRLFQFSHTRLGYFGAIQGKQFEAPIASSPIGQTRILTAARLQNESSTDRRLSAQTADGPAGQRTV